MESRATDGEGAAHVVVEVADVTATLRERIRLQLATPLYRFRLALVIATVLAPGVLAAVAHLPVGPTAAVGLAVLVTCSIPYLDPTIRAATSPWLVTSIVSPSATRRRISPLWLRIPRWLTLRT